VAARPELALPGDLGDGPLVVAASGGADSAALLDLLALERSQPLVAWHLDHGLRPESPADAEAVRLQAARLAAGGRPVACLVERAPVAELARAWRCGLEEAGRRERYRRLAACAAARGAAWVLTAHHRDDQAETVLLNLLRGAGLPGLAGMRAAGHPILGLRRSETAQLCAALDLAPVVDPSNLDPAHLRNRVRHELLPLLDALASRDVAAVLARQAAVLRADADLLDGLAAALDPTDAAALAAAPAPLAARAVRRWLAPLLGGHPPDADAVARVLAVAAGERRACEVGHGVRVERHARRLRTSGELVNYNQSPHGTAAEGEVGAGNPAAFVRVDHQGPAGGV
jgi:tRNA(Ile)-lysidine synthase